MKYIETGVLTAEGSLMLVDAIYTKNEWLFRPLQVSSFFPCSQFLFTLNYDGKITSLHRPGILPATVCFYIEKTKNKNKNRNKKKQKKRQLNHETYERKLQSNLITEREK